jgi:hypothetical protein
MRLPAELLPVIQITLPVVAAIFGASWIQNKRLDDIIARVAAIETRLIRIEERLTRLEERLLPLVRR